MAENFRRIVKVSVGIALAFIISTCGGDTFDAPVILAVPPPPASVATSAPQQSSLLLDNFHYKFAQFNPAPGDVIILPRIDISTVLQVEVDPPKSFQLTVEKFAVNGESVSYKLSDTAEGILVISPGYLCQNPGWYRVLIALHDNLGRRYVKSWEFEYDNEPPHFQGISPIYSRGPGGHLEHSGFRVDLDSRIKPGLKKILGTPQWWRIVTKDGQSYRVVRVQESKVLKNSLELYPAGSDWKGKRAEVEIQIPDLPNWEFKKRRRDVSHEPPCDDPPPEPQDPPPAEIEVMDWGDPLQPPPNPPPSDCSCEVDLHGEESARA